MPITLTSTNPAGPSNSTIVATVDKGGGIGHIQLVTMGDGTTEALRLNDSAAPTLTTLPALMIGSVRKDSATALAGTDGDISVLQVNSTGSLRVDVTAIASMAAITTSVTPGTSAAHLGKAEDAAHSSSDTGVMALSVRTDTPSQRAGTDGDYATINTNASGAVWTTPALDIKQGATPYTLVSAASNNATSLKASQGVVTMLYAYNRSSSEKYVKLYNKATAPAPASDSGLLLASIPVPPSGGVVLPIDASGLQFGTGIGFAIVGSYEVSDNTSVAAGDVILSMGYK